MRTRRLFIIILIAGIMASLPSLLAAQPADSLPAQQEPAPPLGENEPIPFMRSEQSVAAEEPSSSGLLLKTVGSMVFIIGLIFVGAWGAKKLGFGNAKAAAGDDGTQLSVLNTITLGNGRSVSTIKFGSRLLLVGSTPQSFTLLAEEVQQDRAITEAPRSVAELLAEDSISFDAELDHAASRITTIGQGGRLI